MADEYPELKTSSCWLGEKVAVRALWSCGRLNVLLWRVCLGSLASPYSRRGTL